MHDKKHIALLWAKRFLCYFLGQFIMGIGVVFSVKSSLGVSPITSLANIWYLIFGVDKGISILDLGVCTTLSYLLYTVIELAILGKKHFSPTVFLQIIASFIFGFMVSLASSLMSGLPIPEAYPLKMLYLLASVPLVAFGVMLYLAPKILPTPGDGLSIATSKRLEKPLAIAKNIVDCSIVVVSIITSFAYFRELRGVREGTVICAILVGLVMRQFMKLFNEPLMKFVERQSKLQSAIQENKVIATTLFEDQVIVTISSEYGSGGHEIGRRLAARLGIDFHDKDLDKLESDVSGLSLEFVKDHEKKMTSRFVNDILNSFYDFSNDDITPREQLYAAQTKIISGMASKGESFVITGRCSNHILYDNPNTYRIFIHAPYSFRRDQVAKRTGLAPKEARESLNHTDHARAMYYQDMTGKEYGNMKYYNLAIDTSLYDPDTCVELIIEALKLRTKRES